MNPKLVIYFEKLGRFDLMARTRVISVFFDVPFYCFLGWHIQVHRLAAYHSDDHQGVNNCLLRGNVRKMPHQTLARPATNIRAKMSDSRIGHSADCSVVKNRVVDLLLIGP